MQLEAQEIWPDFCPGAPLGCAKPSSYPVPHVTNVEEKSYTRSFFSQLQLTVPITVSSVLGPYLHYDNLCCTAVAHAGHVEFTT